MKCLTTALMARFAPWCWIRDRRPVRNGFVRPATVKVGEVICDSNGGGSQYLSAGYQTHPVDTRMRQSVGRTGVRWNGSAAVAEALWSSVKPRTLSTAAEF